MPMARIWSEENEAFIRESFRHKTYAELAEHFGVSQKAMESKIRRMGLKKQDYRDPEPGPGFPGPAGDEPPAPPVETGPTPIKSSSLTPRRVATPEESEEDRTARLGAELEAAARENERRAQARGEDRNAKALSAFETGVKKFHDGALGKAHEAFQKVLAANPLDSLLTARARQYLVALERKGRSQDFNPQNADEFYLQGVVLLNAGDPGAAIESLRTALEMAPGDDRVLYCQAAAFAQKGDIDAAVEALRAAVDINDANRVYAVNDPDFVPLRVHEDFRSIVSPDPDGA